MLHFRICMCGIEVDQNVGTHLMSVIVAGIAAIFLGAGERGSHFIRHLRCRCVSLCQRATWPYGVQPGHPQSRPHVRPEEHAQSAPFAMPILLERSQRHAERNTVAEAFRAHVCHWC